MKRFLKYFLLLTFIIPSCVMCSNDDFQEKIVIPSEVHKTFREIDDLIINPSQGWLSTRLHISSCSLAMLSPGVRPGVCRLNYYWT